MREDRKGKSFTLVLVVSYIFFIALAAILLVLINLLIGKLTENMVKSPDYDSIVSSQYLLEEKYSRLERYVNNGYLEVLDENANIIYVTDGVDADNEYSVDELEFIDTFGDRNTEYYVSETVRTKAGTNQYVLTKYEEVISDEEDMNNEFYESETKPIGVVILNSDYEILYSSIEFENDVLSKDEISYILDRSSEKDYVIKYDFQNAAGQKRHILIHTNPTSESTWNRIQAAYDMVTPLFVGSVIVLLIIFTLFITRRVSKPLNMLASAMNEFAEGHGTTHIEFRGDKEFENICDTFNDMSDKVKEAERNKLKLEEDRRQMLADISHDLKTPITVIQGYSRAVADDVVPVDKRQSYLNAIVLKADQLADLINQFFEYSKLDHPQFSLDLEPDDICEYFREYLASKYEEISLKGYEMDINIPDQRIMVRFDNMQLKRVFENIINNTLKHNTSGTCIFVSVRETMNKENLIIRIGDNGVGIPKEVRDKIFEPFAVGNESRTSGQGTGLGMTIAKKIVEAHGGTIKLIDSPDISLTTLYEIILPIDVLPTWMVW